MVRKWISKQSSSILSFTLSLLLIVIAFATNGIYWGSDKLILIFDMGSQYAPLYSYLKYVGDGNNSIFYQTLSGFGGSFYGNWAYYLASPLSWFVLLFDESRLPDALYLLTLIKISFCGLTFSLFIRKGHLKCDNFFITVISSVSYALMGYNVAYSMCLMWLDGVILLPLIILGVDRIMDKKKPLLFISSLSLAVISNYYIAFMIVLFLVLYFLWYVFSENISFTECRKKAFVLLEAGILTSLISAFVWLPVMIGLLSRGNERQVLFGIWSFRNPFIVLKGLLPFSYNGFLSQGYPYVYCGVIVAAITITYFFRKQIFVRKRISAALMIAVFMLSFCVEPIDRAWHGFLVPGMYPSRYSFMFVFFALILFSETLICLLSELRRKYSHMIPACLMIAVVLELCINSGSIISSIDSDPFTGAYLHRDVYDKYRLETASAYDCLSDGKYVADYDLTYNDGLMYGLKGVDYYLSDYNSGLHKFLSSIGLSSEDRVISDDYLTPLTASLLGVNNALVRDANSPKSSNVYMLCEYMNGPTAVGDMMIFEDSVGSFSGILTDNLSDEEFLTDSFYNCNVFAKEVSGVGDVFLKCDTEKNKSVDYLDSGYYVYDIIVHPYENEHLLFYVSSSNYYEKSDLSNYDELYLKGERIALYENTGMESVVDLGRATGDPLRFTYVTDSPNNDVYFYSFNEEAYFNVVEYLKNNTVSIYEESNNVYSLKVDAAEDSKILMLIPYEPGYEIKIDGKKTDYQSYRNAFILIPVSKGEHAIAITYHVPGMREAIIFSFIGIISTSFLFLFSPNKQNGQI